MKLVERSAAKSDLSYIGRTLARACSKEQSRIGVIMRHACWTATLKCWTDYLRCLSISALMSNPTNESSLNDWRALTEKAREPWYCIISDKLVYFPQPVDGDLKVSDRVGFINWVPKQNSDDFCFEFNLALFGKIDGYFRYVIRVAPEIFADAEDAELKLNAADSDKLMLVEVAKPVDLPQRMIFKG